MEINHDKLEYISGPISVILLEGEINNVKKKILLFGDYHYRDYQNECDSLNSVPIKNYLVDLFSKTKHTIDFFLETEPMIPGDISLTSNYINQLGEFYNRNIRSFEMVRFHFSDIRYVYKSEFLSFIFGNNISNDIINSPKIYYEDLEYLLKISEDITEYVNFIIYGLKLKPIEFKNLMKKQEEGTHKHSFLKNLYKIFYKYKNKNLQNDIRKIIKIITKNILIEVNQFIDQIKILKSYFRNIKKYSGLQIEKFKDNLNSKINKLKIYYMDLFCIITDIYTIRRILDKDYIENTILYTGAAHTKNLFNILVNNFNFKIININCNIDCKLEKKFVENFFKIASKDSKKKHFYIDGSYDLYKQCIDIRKFKKPLI